MDIEKYNDHINQEQKTPYFAIYLAKYGVFLTIQRTH